ncbi:purple acid phosphatase family protein [Marinobacter zhejiangensis]|uniref:Purple acid Phosphatase, N-terminal domain n=1 Tax=Marinobacter zhejiangensis TaxID=488535 RepID=A0A1I4LPC3_9GAMM|nr:metallophosphoesterase family protein [Marinobacter zhejiangensis]SFL92872.1 Purple acid Phosphatase, N-terminal domain [Marinobacter zhejiangensis]
MKTTEQSVSPIDRTRRTLVASMGGMAALGLSGCGGGSDSSNPEAGGTTPTPPKNNGNDPTPPVDNVVPDIPDTDLYPSDGSHPPRGVHASITGDPHTSRTITWFTDGLEPPLSFVRFSQDSSIFDAQGNPRVPLEHSVTSEESDTFGVAAKTHRATLTALDPELPIFYQVGSDIGGWSRIYTLPPLPTEQWTFVHYGDQGTTDNAQKLHAELLRHPKHLCLIAGDLSYANGDQVIWDLWFDQNEPHMASTVTLAAPGNHENKDGALLESAGGFKTRLSHPQPDISVVASNPGSTFYSFDINRVHFLVSSAGAVIEDFSLPEELINMEVDLSKAALRRLAGEIDFIVVVQHYPIWTDQEGRSPANFTLVALQEQILVRYGVDLLLVGHDHIYQRSAPMFYGIPNPQGYVQVLAGTGGASVRLFDEAPQAWSESEFVGIGFVTYDVEPGRIRANFWGAGPEGLDDSSRQTVTEAFSIRDSFEVHKRSLLSAREHAVLPRDKSEILKNYALVAYDTKQRNHRDEHEC